MGLPIADHRSQITEQGFFSVRQAQQTIYSPPRALSPAALRLARWDELLGRSQGVHPNSGPNRPRVDKRES